MECWHECPICHIRHVHMVAADANHDEYDRTCNNEECARQYATILKERRGRLLRRLSYMREEREFYAIQDS